MGGVSAMGAPSGRIWPTEREEDRLDAQVLAEAKARGFRLAIRCSRCNQWLVASKSVALHLGPTCRRKITQEGS